MAIFDVFGRVRESGEYILGSRDTGSHACYLIYGRIKPGEQDRLFNPGAGHEELILLMQGELRLRGARAGTLAAGQALRLVGDVTCRVDNGGSVEAVYVIAGGHAGDGHR
jgi:hypothetical protein